MTQSYLSSSRFFYWSKKGSIAILDQVLFNGVHFLIAVLLARWLEPVEYGIFAVAYSIFLLFASFHMALLIEPMLIFGAGKYQGIFKGYLNALIFGNFRVTLFGSLILFLVGLPVGLFYSKNLQFALFGLAIALPFILLLWLLRRSFYVRLEPGWPVIGGAIYVILLLLASFLLKISHLLSPATYFLGMGLCSLLVSLFFIYIIRPQRFKLNKYEFLDMKNAHFHYGKWALGTNILAWGVNNIYFIILPFWAGFEGVAGLRALMNLSTPFIQVNSALTFLFIPLISKKKTGESYKIAKVVIVLLVLFSIVGLAYLLGLIIFEKIIMVYLYNNKYTEYSYLIPFIGLLSLLGGISLVLEITLRSLNNPEKVFWSYLVAMMVVLFGGIFFAKTFGVRGVLFNYNLSYIVTIIMLGFFVKTRVSDFSVVEKPRRC
ncbi:MAG: hypothetical protein WC349_04695 [Patescibacteria group bacterium]|jgi:O-antigen/teichoic acid export membrane protein